MLRLCERRGGEIKRLIAVPDSPEQPFAEVTEHLRETEVAVAQLDTRLAELKHQIAFLRSQTIDAEHLRETLAQFDPFWEVLHPHERVALVHQVVASVHYDHSADLIMVALRQ